MDFWTPLSVPAVLSETAVFWRTAPLAGRTVDGGQG